jgi:Lipase (class 3)
LQTPLQVNKLSYHNEDQERKGEQECNKLRDTIESEMQDGGDAFAAKPFPSASFLQKLSEGAYDKNFKPKKHWLQLKNIYCSKSSMMAKIFINSADRQLVVTFKGTTWYSLRDQLTNFLNVFVGGRAIMHCNSAATVGALIRDILEPFHGRVHLIITGHSLGGYLAQLAAFAAKNLRIVDGKFQSVDHENCVEIYPHTVVFDSPAATERILQSTFANPINIESLRLDVTNYVKCGNIANNLLKTTRHLGRVIFVKNDESKQLKFSYSIPIAKHTIDLFESIDDDQKFEVVDLNNRITEPLDESFISSLAFSKKEYTALQILPLLKTLPTKTELYLNYNLCGDSVRIFNENPKSFVPRMRLFLLENSELLKHPVQKIKKFQALISRVSRLKN